MTNEGDSLEFVTIDGEKVKEFRTQNNWTQKYLANLCQIGLRTLIDIENDKKPNRRTRETVESLSKAFECDFHDLEYKGVLYTIGPEPSHRSNTEPSASTGERLLMSHLDTVKLWTTEVATRLKDIKDDHIILYMIAELHRRHRDAISISWDPGRFRLRVPAHYYFSCLEGMSAANSGKGMYAIADTKDSIESMWRRNPDPDKTLIAGRIFLFHLRDFLDLGTLDPIVPMLHRQREMYPVRIGIPMPSDDWEHPLGSNAIGKNMIVLEPDLVGGYVKDGSKTSLEFVSDPLLYAKARKVYATQTERSFELEPGMTPEQIRRKFIEHEKIGEWNNNWGSPGDRTRDYYSKYDANIRCWIPSYNQLLLKCFAYIRDEVGRLIRSPNHPMKILEVGYGTGGLTKPVLEWIDKLNSSWADDNRYHVDEFVGVDSSPQMMQLVMDSIQNAGARIRNLHVANFDRQSLTEIAGNRKFDVIFGSLVLHDILGVDPHETVNDLFELCSEYLTDNGSVVFGDVFIESDDALAQWKEHMTWVGLAENTKNDFIKENPEMVQTVDFPRLEVSAHKHGFIIHAFSRVNWKRNAQTPFYVLVARKVQSVVKNYRHDD